MKCVFRSLLIAALFCSVSGFLPAVFLGIGASGGIKAIGLALGNLNKEKYVMVKNNMGPDVTVTANCASGDDKIGEYVLKDGEAFAWKFKTRIDGRTLFWCDVTTSNGKSHHWDVFKGHDGNKNWYLRGDGIYSGNADGGNLKNTHGW